jgi:predicted ribosomally synthesized peptide with nif11-like leader
MSCGIYTQSSGEITMSSDTLAQFVRLLQQDESLRARLEATADGQEFFATAAQMAAEHGLSFTADELGAAIAELTPPPADELTDAELDQAAGGLCLDTQTRTQAGGCRTLEFSCPTVNICKTDLCKTTECP